MILFKYIKLLLEQNSLEKYDKMIAYLPDENGISKHKVVVESFAPFLFKSRSITVEAEDGNLYIIKHKDIVVNYDAQIRHDELFYQYRDEYHHEKELKESRKKKSKKRLRKTNYSDVRMNYYQ